MRNVWKAVVTMTAGIALSIYAVEAHALQCKEHVYEGDGSGSKCCDEILTGGAWWGEDADGYHMDCTEYVHTVEDAPPGPCAADIADCLPDGSWPFDPPSWWPEEWGGGGGTPPPPPAPTAPDCRERLCWDGKQDCIADAYDDYDWCHYDFEVSAEHDCGEGNGRTGKFRSGVTFEVGDYCLEHNSTGYVCSEDIRDRPNFCDPRVSGQLASPISCEFPCVDSWMEGDSGGTLRVSGFKIKWGMKGPSAELAFEVGAADSYASYNSVCNARLDAFLKGCETDIYLACRADQRKACGASGVTYSRTPIDIAGGGAGACFGANGIIYLHEYQ